MSDIFEGLGFLDAVVSGNWASARACLEPLTGVDDSFLRFLARHDLAPYLQWRLEGEGFSALPGWLRISLFGFRERDRELQQRVQAQLDHVAAHCDSSLFVTLKGPTLAQRLYGDVSARRFSDLDLLAAPGEFEGLRQHLLDAGFRDEQKTLYPRPWLKYFVHATALQRDGIDLDLHSTLRVRPAYRLDCAKIWNERISVELPGGGTVFTPSDEHNLLVLLLTLTHDLELGTLRAKTLVDLQAACKQYERENSWDAFFKARRPERLEAISLNALNVARKVLPAAMDMPGLNSALSRRQDQLRPLSREEALALVSAPPYRRANRRWYLSIYPGNTAAYLGWLALGVPAKRNVASAIGQSLSPEG